MLLRIFRDALENELKEQLSAAEKAARQQTNATAEIERQRDEVESKLQQICQEYPNLESDLAIFNATEEALPDALAVFEALAENAQRWSKVFSVNDNAKPEYFSRVLQNLLR
ncbi:MAG: hypothetical protein R3F37_17955 [Candidatus Competibacteraceae bacterium]